MGGTTGCASVSRKSPAQQRTGSASRVSRSAPLWRSLASLPPAKRGAENLKGKKLETVIDMDLLLLLRLVIIFRSIDTSKWMKVVNGLIVE